MWPQYVFIWLICIYIYIFIYTHDNIWYPRKDLPSAVALWRVCMVGCQGDAIYTGFLLGSVRVSMVYWREILNLQFCIQETLRSLQGFWDSRFVDSRLFEKLCGSQTSRLDGENLDGWSKKCFSNLRNPGFKIQYSEENFFENLESRIQDSKFSKKLLKSQAWSLDEGSSKWHLEDRTSHHEGQLRGQKLTPFP